MFCRVSPDDLSRQLKSLEPDLEQKEQPTATSGSHLLGDITWTKSLKRLYTLIVQCLDNNEPVLLVGGTGCGKTTVCQVGGGIAWAEAEDLAACFDIICISDVITSVCILCVPVVVFFSVFFI